MSAVSVDRPTPLPGRWVKAPLGAGRYGSEEPDVVATTGLSADMRPQGVLEGIIGHSPALAGTLKQAELVAVTDSTVLIHGETGTGKELIAEAIHRLSPRRHNNLIKINCAAIPSGLLESELFGHERGAFTGAVNQRIGRFQLAHKGSLFLDEIGDLPPELQPKLLRVLQEKEFERLGSSRTLKTDVRVIAATHRDLAQMVQDGKLRSDLYYRLNVFPITVPPLRERGDDLLLLARHFAERYARQMNKGLDAFTREATEALAAYHWPGNIRELQNVIERAVILSEDGVLLPEMPESMRLTSAASSFPRTLEEVERQHIIEVLRETNWVIGGQAGAAAMLGLNRSTLNFRMRKLGIFRPAL
jgi:formate hydrogenlyase transcriptional activator